MMKDFLKESVLLVETENMDLLIGISYLKNVKKNKELIDKGCEENWIEPLGIPIGHLGAPGVILWRVKRIKEGLSNF